MKNINWSKWIAIALSVFIVTQFIQVSFLAAGQIGGGQASAGADASRGSIAEEIYQGVWDKVGDSDSLILSASAEEEELYAEEDEAGAEGDADTTQKAAVAEIGAQAAGSGADADAGADEKITEITGGDALTDEETEKTGGTEGNISATETDPERVGDDGTVTETTKITNNVTDGKRADVVLTSVTYKKDGTGANTESSVTDKKLILSGLSEAEYGNLMLNFEVTFALETGATLKAGDTITVDLPSGFTNDTTNKANTKGEGSLKLKSSPNTEIGNIAAEADIGENKIKLTLLEAAATAITSTSENKTATFSIANVKVTAATTNAAATSPWQAITGGTSIDVTLPAPEQGIKITRINRMLKKGASETKVDTKISGAIYTLYTAAGGTEVSWRGTAPGTTTGDNGSVTILGMDAGTYYLKETTTPNSAKTALYDGEIDAVVPVSGTTPTEGTSIDATDGYYGITVTADQVTEIYVIDYAGYSIELVDQNNTPISGVKMEMTGSFHQKAPADGITYTGNKAEWNSGSSAVTFEGELIVGEEYTLKVPSAESGGTPAEYRITVNDSGKFTATLQAGNTEFSVNTGTDGKLVVTRKSSTAKLLVQMVDKETGANPKNIRQSGVNYRYGKMDGASPTTAELAVATAIATDAEGILTFTLTPGTSDENYFLVEAATGGAPAGYTANGTDKYYTFKLTSAGVLSNFSATFADSTSGTKTIEYARIPAKFTIIRETTAAMPTTVTYGVYTNGNATGAPVATITLNKGATQTTGTLSTGLSWNTQYWLKETTNSTGYAPLTDILGPYTFGPTMSYNNAREKSDVSTMTITIYPEKSAAQTIDFILYGAVSSDATTTARGAQALTGKCTITGSFADGTDSKTLEFADGKAVISDLFQEGTYTIKAPAPVAATATTPYAIMAQTWTFTVGSDGLISAVSPAATTPKYIYATNPGATTAGTGAVRTNSTYVQPCVSLFADYTALTVTMDICTAEQGYSTSYINPSEEIRNADGFTFAFSRSESSGQGTISLKAVKAIDDSGKTDLNVAVTDGWGEASLYGLCDNTYYVRCTTSSAVSDAKQVSLDTKSYFRLILSGGEVTKVATSSYTVSGGKTESGGAWKVAALDSDEVEHVRAYLKQGSITLTGDTSKTYYLYRLYSDYGSGDLDDGREEEKLAGSVEDYDDTDETKSGVYVKRVTNAADVLEKGWNALRAQLVLRASAADAKTLEYPKDSENTWQLIGSYKPTSSSDTEAFKGLISGQYYLIREGTSTTPGSSDNYYLVKNMSESGKTLAAASTTATTGASGASTGKSGASNASTSKTTTGSGTASGGGAAGARGSATGDGNDLWAHLIVMLIAFDALVADLLYISRKKRPVQSR